MNANTYNPAYGLHVVAVALTDLQFAAPSCLGGGFMPLTGHDLSEWDWICRIVDLIPKDYYGGDLDPDTSDLIFEEIGHDFDSTYQNTTIHPDEARLVFYELVQQAMILRCYLPRHLYDFRHVGGTEHMLYIAGLPLPEVGYG